MNVARIFLLLQFLVLSVFGCDSNFKKSIEDCNDYLFLDFCVQESEIKFKEKLGRLFDKGILELDENKSEKAGFAIRHYTFYLEDDSVKFDFKWKFDDLGKLEKITLWYSEGKLEQAKNEIPNSYIEKYGPAPYSMIQDTTEIYRYEQIENDISSKMIPTGKFNVTTLKIWRWEYPNKSIIIESSDLNFVIKYYSYNLENKMFQDSLLEIRRKKEEKERLDEKMGKMENEI